MVRPGRRDYLPRAEAIRLAERFVAENGYTDLPVDSDAAKLTLEPIEFASNTKERLEIRRDTLERKAADAYPMGDGWEVAFRCRRKGPGPESRRGVWVPGTGKPIRIFHQDVY
jgi:hypothetical protein